VEKGERALFIRIGDDRELKLHLKLSFDDRGMMRQRFMLRDRQIRRRPDYEELDREHSFETLDQAIAFVVRVCD